MWSGASFIVGTMIGSGIFASPGSVLLQAKSVGLSLVAWTLSGLIALFGSACYAELGTRLQASGGEYVYIDAGLNSFLAFLFSWSSCIITRPGSQAIMVLVSGQYFVRCFFLNGEEPASWIATIVSIFMNTTLVLVNSVNVRFATALQSYSTAVKVLVLIVIAVIGLVYLGRDAQRSDSPAHDNLANSFQTNHRKCQ